MTTRPMWSVRTIVVILGALAALASPRPLGAAAGVPAAGSPAPDFSLTNNLGKTTSLKDYRGKWVVLYFYPKDFTSGCTVEAHNFQRDAAKYEKAGAVIVGVSVDSADSHKSFCAKEGLGFTLLSDPDGKVSSLYGSLTKEEGVLYAERNTFLIDPEGRIARVFTDVDPSGHSTEVLGALAALHKG